jgi:UDP-N-acetylglucosamine 3-dehydrogenase
MTLRWGIIGFGRFGRIHAEVLHGIDGCQVAGVCSRRPIDSALLPETAGEVTADVEQFVQRDDLDIILVATHWRDHFSPSAAALRAGKHVFIEKPLAATEEECDQLVELAESTDSVCMVGHVCRFDPRIWLARQAVLDGQLGRIVYMRSRRNLPVAPGTLRLDKVSPLIGDGVHDADLMMWLMNRGPDRISGVSVKAHSYDYDDIGCAWLHFGNDAVGYVETVWCLPKQTHTVIDAHLEIIGTDGHLKVDCSITGLEVTSTNGTRRVDTSYWPLIDGSRQGALRDELLYFTDCVRENRQPQRITIAEAARAVKAMLCAEKSAQQGVPLAFDG